MKGDARQHLRWQIGELLGVEPDHVTLFAKGRVALYAILRALGVGPGDEVILPAFTCVAVPNAIRYAGARPVWVDVDARTYGIDPRGVEAAVSPRTRVILAQNTFGLSADLESLTVVAKRYSLTIVDDCAHGLGGRYGDRPNGTSSPVSFFSTQWSKPISTGLGGFAVARDAATADRLHHLEETALEPSAARIAALRLLIYAREHAGAGSIFQAGRATYRVLSQLPIFPGSSSRIELEGTKMPAGFFARLSGSQAQLASERIAQLPGAINRRRSIAHDYSEWLSTRGRTVAVEPPEAVHGFLRYPLRVRDRSAVVAASARARIDLGDWFVSPIHPVVANLERWGYIEGSAPTAERVCREIVNLPTDPGMSGRDVQRVLAFLNENVDLIC